MQHRFSSLLLVIVLVCSGAALPARTADAAKNAPAQPLLAAITQTTPAPQPNGDLLIADDFTDDGQTA
ncbi:MAG: hypothetical protein R6W76_05545, partial [Caldilinea sp.]